MPSRPRFKGDLYSALASPGLGRALAVLRESQGLANAALAQAAGIDAKAVTAYEKGDRKPSARTLTRLLRVLQGTSFELHDLAGYLVGSRRRNPAPLVSGELTRALESLSSSRLRPRSRRISHRTLAEELAEARRIWKVLEPLSFTDQMEIVDEAEEVSSWALCELICGQSCNTTRVDASRAVDLSKLAVYVADRLSGTEGDRARAAGYCLAFLGNAKRVVGDLLDAEKDLRQAEPLWHDGRSGQLHLAHGDFLQIRSSLLRDQLRLGEALSCLNQASQAEIRGLSTYSDLLISKAFVHFELGDHKTAITLLRQTAPHSPRLEIARTVNLSTSLLLTGRASESRQLAAQGRLLASRNGYPLDSLRVLWLEGWIDKVQGNSTKGVATFRQVRAQFKRRRMAVDSALATLQLAEILLDKEKWAEMRTLEEDSTWILATPDIPSPILAALRRHFEAAR